MKKIRSIFLTIVVLLLLVVCVNFVNSVIDFITIDPVPLPWGIIFDFSESSINFITTEIDPVPLPWGFTFEFINSMNDFITTEIDPVPLPWGIIGKF